MIDYQSRAALEMTEKLLNVTRRQLDLVGRVLATVGNDPLIQSYSLEISDGELRGGKPHIYVSIGLEPSYKERAHEDLQRKIQRALRKQGVGSQELFSYSTYSWGIEQEEDDVHVHFGFDYLTP